MFIDGYLAISTAFPTPATITEYAQAPYARQPISFPVPRGAVTRNRDPFSFGGSLAGAIAGFAIFSTATGPELLLTLPLAAPYSFGRQPPQLDAGMLCLSFADLVLDPTGAASANVYAPGAVLGTCWRDPADFTGYSPAVNPSGTQPPGGPQKTFATGAMVAGTALTMKRGILSASEMA